jgi:hypothetical protein
MLYDREERMKERRGDDGTYAELHMGRDWREWLGAEECE